MSTSKTIFSRTATRVTALLVSAAAVTVLGAGVTHSPRDSAGSTSLVRADSVSVTVPPVAASIPPLPGGVAGWD